MGSVAKLLISAILIIMTCSFRLTGFERDVQVDLWQTGSEYDFSIPTSDDRANCEDNDIDEDSDTQFVNEEPKLYTAIESIKKQTSIFADIFYSFFDNPLINPYWETLFEKMESPRDSPYLASLLLRAPPAVPA